MVLAYCFNHVGVGGLRGQARGKRRKGGEKKKEQKNKRTQKKRYCGVIELIFCGKVFLMRFSVSYEETGGGRWILANLH